MKALIFSVILIFGVLFNIAPLKSQSIRTIQADTIFSGYDSGETSSVKIINHGTNLIYNHSGKLYEMSAITYKPIREIKLDESLPVTKFSVYENSKYIIYNTDSDKKTFVADYNTGKTINTLTGRFYLSKDYLFLHYKDLIYNEGYSYFKIARLKINDLAPVDTFTLKCEQRIYWPLSMGGMRSNYNTNHLIVELISTGTYEYAGMLSDISWIEIDFDAQNSKSVAKSQGGCKYYISSSEKSSVTVTYEYKSVSFKPTVYECIGTNFLIKSPAGSFELTESGLQKKFNDNNLHVNYNYNFTFLNDKYLCFSIDYTANSKEVTKILVYDLESKILFKIIDFDNEITAGYNDNIFFSNYYGCIAKITQKQLVAP